MVGFQFKNYIKLLQVEFEVAHQSSSFDKGEFIGIGIRRALEKAFKSTVCKDCAEECDHCDSKGDCPFYNIFCAKDPQGKTDATKPYRVRILREENGRCTCQLQLLEPIMKYRREFNKAIRAMRDMAEHKLRINDVTLKNEEILSAPVDVSTPEGIKKLKLTFLTPLVLKVKGRNIAIPKLNYVLVNLIRKFISLADVYGFSKFASEELTVINALLPQASTVPFTLDVEILEVKWDDIFEYPAIQGSVEYDLEHFRLTDEQKSIIAKCLKLGMYIGLGSLRVAGLGDFHLVVCA